HSKKLTLGICLVLLIILIGGCVIMTKTNGRNAQIKENFNKTLSVYPTKNLDDFYDKEGFRDQEFDKRDKGTWIIYSEMVKAQINQKLSEPETKKIYSQRKIDVEPVFGFMKAILGFTRMSVRGINKVKRELGFVLMALNIRKIAAQRAVHYQIHLKKEAGT
ncbi:Csa1 family protein, partial [Staphylococcus aureus]